MDTKLSIDTISEISQHEASPVTTTSPRTAFEQQLCTHLLSLSEVVETLADRLMELETRLAAVEGQQLEDAEIAAVSDDAGELLLASEEKVRMLRDRLSPGEVVELHADSHAEEAQQSTITTSQKLLKWRWGGRWMTTESRTRPSVTSPSAMTRNMWMIPRSICSPPDQASSSNLIRKAATWRAMSGELIRKG